MPAPVDPACVHFSSECPSRLLFDEMADKWSMMVLTVLQHGPLRFNAIRRLLEGVTQKSLTRSLRRLERNGMLERRVIASSPVAVEYELTALGRSLHEPFRALYGWFMHNMDRVEQARSAFDQRAAETVAG